MSEFPVPWRDESATSSSARAGYTHMDGGFNATHRAIMPVFPDLTDEERTRSTFALMPPTLCFGTAPDQCFFFLVRPKTARHDRRGDRLPVPPFGARRPAVRAQAQAVRRRRAGVRAAGPGRHHQGAARLRSRFAPRGRYSWQEESHVQFNRWLVQRYRRHWGATASE
jgi:hypothetical protein